MLITNIRSGLRKYLDTSEYTLEQQAQIMKFYTNHKNFTIEMID